MRRFKEKGEHQSKDKERDLCEHEYCEHKDHEALERELHHREVRQHEETENRLNEHQEKDISGQEMQIMKVKEFRDPKACIWVNILY